jgi:putative NADH-flavin reductase
MPALVVGADTPQGARIIDALVDRDGELRAFVSTPAARTDLLTRGIPAANGDVSDGSHVGGAAYGAFCVVCVSTATHDDRERSFATTPAAVVAQWVDGLKDAEVTRVIWVSCDDVDGSALAGIGVEFVAIDFDDTAAARIRDLVDAETV